MTTVVVVGGGLAGAHTCEQLRARQFTGRIVLLGAESRPTYDRPPLSKDVLTQGADLPALAIDWAGLDIERRLGVSATTLRRASNAWLVGTTAEDIAGDMIVIATGARPRPVGQTSDGPQACVLRTWDDAAALRGRLEPSAQVVVIGAGWIGAEVASSAAELGCRVTVVEAEPTPLARVVGQTIGAHVAQWFAESGVRLIVGEQVTDIQAGRVMLTSGAALAADVTVAGIGVVPNTEWLRGTGIALDATGGVLVDEHLESNLPGVFSVGDCAAYPSTRYGVRLRPEHWTNAQLSGASVAANLTGQPEVHDPVPYFWSKQFGRMVQYCGHHSEQAELVLRGDPTAAKWSAGWVEAGRLTALLTVNKPGECVIGRRLLVDAPLADPARLADADVPLAQTLTVGV